MKQKAWAPCTLSSSFLSASVHTRHPWIPPFGPQLSLTRGAFSDTAPLSSTSALLLVLGRQSIRKSLRFTKEQRKFCGYFRGDSTRISMVTRICTKEFLSLCYVQNVEEPEHVRVAIALRDPPIQPSQVTNGETEAHWGQGLRNLAAGPETFSLPTANVFFFAHFPIPCCLLRPRAGSPMCMLMQADGCWEGHTWSHTPAHSL